MKMLLRSMTVMTAIVFLVVPVAVVTESLVAWAIVAGFAFLILACGVVAAIIMAWELD